MVGYTGSVVPWPEDSVTGSSLVLLDDSTLVVTCIEVVSNGTAAEETNSCSNRKSCIFFPAKRILSLCTQTMAPC